MRKINLFVISTLFLLAFALNVNAIDVNDAHDISLLNSATNDNEHGARFLVNQPVKLLYAYQDTRANAVTCLLGYTANNTYIANVTYVNHIANFSALNIVLQLGIEYKIVGKSTGATYYYNNGASYPVSRTNLNYTGGWYDGSTSGMAEIMNITTTTELIPPTPSPSDNINLSLTLPTSYTNFTTKTINFNLSMNNTYSVNCSFYHNFSTSYVLNETKVYPGGTNTPINFTKTFSSDIIGLGYYVYCVQANDTTQNETTAISIINIDTTSPTIASNINNKIVNDYTNMWVSFTDLRAVNFTIKDSCNFTFNQAFNGSTSFNKSINYSTYAAGCVMGQYHTNITSCDNLGNCITPLTYNWNITGLLNITSRSVITGLSISDFAIYLNGTFASSTTSGQAILNITSPGDYNITIDATGYALESHVLSIPNSKSNYTFNLFGSNSLSISILDEVTGSPIYKNISIQFTGNSTIWTNQTNTSQLYIESLDATEYSILFYGGNYSTRTYTVTVGNKTHQYLTAYLIPPDYSTIFTILDKDTNIQLSNISVAMYKQINSTWTVVENKYTDITGRVQFYYNPVGSYKFYLSGADYDDYVFFLNPILFSAYDIKMTKTTLINYSSDFDALNIIYAPGTFANNQNTTFNFIIASPTGLLTDYGIRLVYPGGTSSATGVNAIGGQLSAWVNVSNANAFDTVRLEYYYRTTTSGLRNFTALLPITHNSDSTGFTFMSNNDKTFGLGIFERILICTIIILFAMGIATMVGQMLAGFALALFIMGYMVFIGFLPLWIILPAAFMGVLMIIWRSGGY